MSELAKTFVVERPGINFRRQGRIPTPPKKTDSMRPPGLGRG